MLWKIGGEAGFGIMTTGLVFSKIASRSGYHIFDYTEYPSLIRGGHNTYEVLVSNQEVAASKDEIDLLICLNRETFKLHQERLTKDSIVVYDKSDFKIENKGVTKIDLPIRKILKEEEADFVMSNNVALGASLALMGWDLKHFDKIIEDTFSKKGGQIVDQNKKVARRGFDQIRENYAKLINKEFPERKGEEKMVLTGNDSFSLGAVVADCRLYCAYPMTPSSSVLHTLASYAEKVGMIVRHAEDEISVINTALGASFAGVRSAVGTSGGGFALMVETISLAGVAELPLVVFLAQRPGPATGMPTWSEQGDLLFAIRAGHGEFPKIVLSPGDVEEMYKLTSEAFDLADIYQTPVIVISDKFLSESHKTTSLINFKLFANSYSPDRGKTINQMKNEKYLRYQMTDDGISPRLIPGAEGFFYQANSYEHRQDGHTTEKSKQRIEQVNKRNRKKATYLAKHFKKPKVIGDLKKSDLVFVSWGSSKGPIIEAIKMLKEQGRQAALIHFTHVFPLEASQIKPFFAEKKRYVLIEGNSQAQFNKLLKEEVGVSIEDKLLKYDGRPFWPEEIVNYVNKLT